MKTELKPPLAHIAQIRHEIPGVFIFPFIPLKILVTQGFLLLLFVLFCFFGRVNFVFVCLFVCFFTEKKGLQTNQECLHRMPREKPTLLQIIVYGAG